MIFVFYSKIYPTLSGRWHCLNSRPMLPDDSQLEKMFAGKPKCNIVDLCLKANQGKAHYRASFDLV